MSQAILLRGKGRKFQEREILKNINICALFKKMYTQKSVIVEYSLFTFDIDKIRLIRCVFARKMNESGKKKLLRLIDRGINC